MNTITVNLYDMLLCLSNAVDLVAPEVSNHHQKVASLAFRLAQHMNFTREEQQNILIAGMLHDIGALSIDERLELLEEEPVTVNSHAFRSARLLEEIGRFGAIADMVRYHHVPWDRGNGMKFKGKDVPLASHVLHLADRTSAMIKPGEEVLSQLPDILSRVRLMADECFMPQMVDALMELGGIEHVWLSLVYKAPLDYIPAVSIYTMAELGLDEAVQISRVFSRVIDFRSRFTATHSAGVAKTAEKLGEIAGFSRDECKMLLIAGYLHDLGKLAIDNSLLEKPSALNEKEYGVIRSHSFYTYRLLDTVEGFRTINKWASFHHERLDGNGYPFHIKNDSIPLGSRIVAVADIFTAVTEPRPYRKGMEKEQVVNVLQAMAKDGSICPEVVSMALKNFDLLTGICNSSQRKAEMSYERFFVDG